ncbi:HlyD family secretion protein [Aliihoeflea sp. PC F10.4]
MSRLKVVLLLGAVVLLAVGFYWWWRHQTLYPSSDDAYLQAHIFTVTPQVSGTISEIDLVNNQHVTAGDILLRIDDQALRLAVDQARAQLTIAQQNADSATQNVAAAQAQVEAAQSSLTESTTELTRSEQLLSTGVVTNAVVDQLRAAQQQATAQLSASRATLAAAQAQAGSGAMLTAGVEVAQAALGQAQVELDHATVTAPASGWVANLSLRPNQAVTAGVPLFSVVEDEEWWVDANFKETDLERVRPGQPATISVDMYPGVRLSGEVESIGAGSGATFSLLPPENATGNWVKVTQRFPVRIRLTEETADPAMQLRVGASVTVTIDTTGEER